MLKELFISIGSNFIFSLCLFTYKRYHHEKYDEIIRRLYTYKLYHNEKYDEIIARLERIEEKHKNNNYYK